MVGPWLLRLEQRFRSIFYDVTRIDGSEGSLSLHVDGQGAISSIDPPPPAGLPASPIWRIGRGTRSSAGGRATIVKTLEDTPFYARSLVEMKLDGGPATAMHESLSLGRFISPVVQLMLPFRMPRRTRAQ